MLEMFHRLGTLFSLFQNSKVRNSVENNVVNPIISCSVSSKCKRFWSKFNILLYSDYRMKACCLAIVSRVLELVKIKMKNEIQLSRKVIRNSNDIKWQKTKLNETSKMTSKN